MWLPALAVVGTVVMCNGMVIGAQTDADTLAALVATNGFLLTAFASGAEFLRRLGCDDEEESP